MLSDEVWLGSLEQVRSALRTPASYRLSPGRVSSGIKMLALLSHRVAFKETMKQYYLVCTAVVVPWISLEKAADAVSETLRDEFTTPAHQLALVERIFKKTGEPLLLDEQVTAETLHETFTGPNLRWEILGVFFTFLALGLQDVEDDSHQQATEREEIIAQLVHASNTCVSFCDRAESSNDVLVWL